MAFAQYNLGPKAAINLRFRQGLVNVFAISSIPIVERGQSVVLSFGHWFH
jgi:hypothetical protein